MKHQQAAGHHAHDKPVPKSASRSSAKSRKSPAPDGADRDGDSADGGANGRCEMIRQTAYGFYLARGCVDGHELEDWLQAEAVVDGTHTGSPQAQTT